MEDWRIYKATKELIRIYSEHGFDVVFFDGRGGPPARGGGKSHKFYASMERKYPTKKFSLPYRDKPLVQALVTLTRPSLILNNW